MTNPTLVSLSLAAAFAAAQESTTPIRAPRPELSGPATWFDVDADGLEDALALSPEGGLRLLRNLGDGSFHDVTADAGLPATAGAAFARWGDLDADGHADLYVGTVEGAPQLFRNRGDGTFFECGQELGLDHAGRDLDAQWIDYDGDGALDLIAWTAAGALGYHNVGGTFERVELGLVPFPTGAGGVAVLDGAAGGLAADRAAPGARGADGRDGSGGFGGTQTFGSSGGPGVTATRAPGGTAGVGAGLCVDGLFDQSGGACINASNVPTLGMLFPLTPDLFVTPAGNVGVGTTTPAGKLGVSGRIVANDHVVAPFGTTSNPSFRFGGGSEDSGISSPVFESVSIITDAVERVRVSANGNVGIGDSSPASLFTVGNGDKFQVDGTAGDVTFTDDQASITFPATDGLNAPMINMFASGVSNGDRMVAAHSPAFPDWGLRYVDNGDRFEFISSGTPRVTVNLASGARLDVHGIARVDTLQIDGGADLVELFETGDEECEPGTVVVIDPRNPGRLATSDEPYDSRVAGIVSGANGLNPGIQLGQDGVADGDTLVAMTGRVFVKATAENGAIQPGDLLTTASIAGHAMRATDRERSFGAVIGKAMGALEEGTGMVLVLVNLQ